MTGAAREPIACSLSPPALADRRAEAARLFADALTRGERAPALLTLRFRPALGVAERVEALAAAERACCPFLDIAVTRGDDEIGLRIAAPPGAEEVLDVFESLAAESVAS